uniref:BTB domain-containing protein n=1 Tax=Rhabditophanes sp. KR3021 TaxID=114890 RepID=A0AC35TUK6_9BILA
MEPSINYEILLNQKQIDVSAGKFTTSVTYLGYVINVDCQSLGDSKEKTRFIVTTHAEGEDIYELVIHWRLKCGSFTEEIKFDFWDGHQIKLLEVVIDGLLHNDVTFGIAMVEVKNGADLCCQADSREFKLKCGENVYYVNLGEFKEIAGTLYQEIEKAQKEDKFFEVNQVMPDDFKVFIEGCLKYDSINVNRRNYLTLMRVAKRLKANNLLRTIETFLISDKEIHAIRKLEISVIYRMARLCDSVTRSFSGNSLKMIGSLHEYMEKNGESMENQHPLVLKIFDIGHDYVLIA